MSFSNVVKPSRNHPIRVTNNVIHGRSTSRKVPWYVPNRIPVYTESGGPHQVWHVTIPKNYSASTRSKCFFQMSIPFFVVSKPQTPPVQAKRSDFRQKQKAITVPSTLDYDLPKLGSWMCWGGCLNMWMRA